MFLQNLVNSDLFILPVLGLTYAGCLQDEEHAGGVELVIFSSSTTGNFSRERCNSKCFHENQRYGGLGQQNECLCSTNSEPNHISESQCSAACSDPLVMKECRWTVAKDVFQVRGMIFDMSSFESFRKAWHLFNPTGELLGIPSISSRVRPLGGSPVCLLLRLPCLSLLGLRWPFTSSQQLLGQYDSEP